MKTAISHSSIEKERREPPQNRTQMELWNNGVLHTHKHTLSVYEWRQHSEWRKQLTKQQIPPWPPLSIFVELWGWWKRLRNKHMNSNILCPRSPIHHVFRWRDFRTLLHPTPYKRHGEEGGLLWLVTCQGWTGHTHWTLRLPGSACFQNWPPVICSPLSQASLGEPVLQGDTDRCRAEQWRDEQVHLIQRQKALESPLGYLHQPCLPDLLWSVRRDQLISLCIQ